MSGGARVSVALVVHGGDHASNTVDPPCLELEGDGHTVRCSSGAIPGASRTLCFERIIGDAGRPDDDWGALVRDSVAQAMGGGRAVIAAIGAIGTGKTRAMGLLPPFGCDGVLQAVFRCLFAELDRRGGGSKKAARPRVGISIVEVDGHQLLDLVGPANRETQATPDVAQPVHLGFDDVSESRVQLGLDEDTREEQAVSLIERACQKRRHRALGASPSHSLTHAIVTVALDPPEGAPSSRGSLGCIQLLDLCPVSSAVHGGDPEAHVDHALCGLRTLAHSLAPLASDSKISHLPDLHERSYVWTTKLFGAALAAGARLHVLVCVRADADAGTETSTMLDYAKRCEGMNTAYTNAGVSNRSAHNMEPEPEPMPATTAEDVAQIYAAIAPAVQMTASAAANEADNLESRGECSGANLLRAAVQAAAGLEVSRQQAVDESAELGAQLAQLRIELLNAKLRIADMELRGADDGPTNDDGSDVATIGPDNTGGRDRSASDVAMLEKARRLEALNASPVAVSTPRGREEEVSSFSLALFKEGWKWPTSEEMGGVGTALIGRQICVLGMGCGTVVDFKQNYGRGASHHEIEFEEDAACVVGESCSGERRLRVKLKRKTNTDPEKKEWLILPTTGKKAGSVATTVISDALTAGSHTLKEADDTLSGVNAAAQQQPFGGSGASFARSTQAASQKIQRADSSSSSGSAGGHTSTDTAPLSPMIRGTSGPALPQSQSRLGRSGSLHGQQRGGGWTALSEWRMPGLPRPGSMLGGMVGVKVAIQKTETEYSNPSMVNAEQGDDGEASESLWLPLSRTLSGGSNNEPRSHTVYLLRVQHSEAGWGGILRKRFNDFVQLADDINEALNVARHFPSKRLLFNMDPEVVEERREELQLWMLTTVAMHENIARQLRDFLEEPIALEWGGLGDGLPVLAMDPMRYRLDDP